MEPIVSLNNATLRLGDRVLWKKLTIAVHAGECVAILGPNGSGKSSLIKVLLGLHKIKGGVQILGTKPQYARERIGYIPQQKSFDRSIPLTGRDLVRLGANGTKWFVRATSPDEESRINAAISEVGAQSYANKPLGL